MKFMILLFFIFSSSIIAYSQIGFDCNKCLLYKKQLEIDKCEDSIICNSTFKLCGYFDTLTNSGYTFITGFVNILKRDTLVALTISEADSYSIRFNEDSLIITEHIAFYNFLENDYSIFKPFKEFVFLSNDSSTKPISKIIKFHFDELYNNEVIQFNSTLKRDIKKGLIYTKDYWTIYKLNLLFYSTQLLDNKTACSLFESLITERKTKQLFYYNQKNPTQLQIEYIKLSQLYNCFLCN